MHTTAGCSCGRASPKYDLQGTTTEQVAHSGWTALPPLPPLPALELPTARQAPPQVLLPSLLLPAERLVLLQVLRLPLQDVLLLPLLLRVLLLLLAHWRVRRRQLAGVPARGVPPRLRPPAAQRSPFPALESPGLQPGRSARLPPPHCTPGSAGSGAAAQGQLSCGRRGTAAEAGT